MCSSRVAESADKQPDRFSKSVVQPTCSAHKTSVIFSQNSGTHLKPQQEQFSDIDCEASKEGRTEGWTERRKDGSTEGWTEG